MTYHAEQNYYIRFQAQNVKIPFTPHLPPILSKIAYAGNKIFPVPFLKYSKSINSIL